jgi:hypothetical protein
MKPEEVHLMSVERHRVFVRYQNHTIKEWERRN